jgi:hypothetical protein
LEQRARLTGLLKETTKGVFLLDGPWSSDVEIWVVLEKDFEEGLTCFDGLAERF